MRNIAALSIIVVLSVTGCRKNADKNDLSAERDGDYVLVQLVGMIPTSTVYFFNDSEIRKDSLFTQLLNTPDDIHGRKLSDADFQKGKFVFFNVPESILNDANEYYGCPNCADGGAIIFIVHKNGREKKMSLEWSPGNYPEYLKTYMEEVMQILREI